MDRQGGRLTTSLGAEVVGGSEGPVIFLSVGETSGDLHGAALARALRARIPGVRLVGLGGPRMASEGVELLAEVSDLAVMGFVEVLSRLPFFLRLRRQVFDALMSHEVDLVIPVDYPGFNLRLARHAHSIGLPVLYYIAPQVWAWHTSRARNLAEVTDRVAVILPFEEELLGSYGAAAEFVGHPLLDLEAGERFSDRDAWLATQGLDPGRPLLALFPGSRAQEVARHLPIFAEAADRIVADHPELQVCIGAAPGLSEAAYGGVDYSRTRATAELLRYATAALVKSGTTTLEAALAGTPFVVAYRMNSWTYRMAKRLVKVPHIALANLVAGRRVVPEFVQDEATPTALSQALRPLLDPANLVRQEMVESLGEVRRALRKGGAAERVAELAADLLAEGRPAVGRR